MLRELIIFVAMFLIFAVPPVSSQYTPTPYYNVYASISATSAPPSGTSTVTVRVTNTGTVSTEVWVFLFTDETGYRLPGWASLESSNFIKHGSLTPGQNKEAVYEITIIDPTSPGTYQFPTMVYCISGGYAVCTKKIYGSVTVTSPPKGTIAVWSSPTGASVHLDGIYKGTTTSDWFYIYDVSVGSHTIKLAKSGYSDWSQTVYVSAGKTEYIRAYLTLSTGSISISSTPSGAEIYLDGAYKGTTPLSISGVTAGSHTIKLVKSGYNEYITSVYVEATKTATLFASLTLKTGSIYVSSNPSSANVYLNGIHKGVTPITIPDVSPGTHMLKLTKSDYEDLTETVTVSAGSTTTLTKNLVEAIYKKAEAAQKTAEKFISLSEALLTGLTELIQVGKNIGADVSIPQENVNSAGNLLKDAKENYALAVAKYNEKDYQTALTHANAAYTKGLEANSTLNKAKASITNSLEKTLNEKITSTESLVNYANTFGFGSAYKQKINDARKDAQNLHSAIDSNDFANAKSITNNVDSMLGKIKTEIYAIFGGSATFLSLIIGLVAKKGGVLLGIAKGRKEKRIQIAEPEERVIGEFVKAITVRGLSKKYKNAKILNDISFSLDQGKLCAIVGPSGGGKSTVVESLVGRISPDAGEIEILGKSTETQREELNKLVGFVPQHPELYMDQTMWQNMMNSAIKWSVKDAEVKSEKILKMLGIYERKDVLAKNLSGGQLKRLSLGMELIRGPPLLVLDEPTTGLDPTSRDQILSALSKIVYTDKKTAIFTTHFMDEAEHCDDVVLVGNAKILAKGAPSELARKMPGHGKIVQVTLEEVSQDMVSKISKIEGIRKVIREGRVLKIIMDSPEVVKISQKIEEFGGAIEGSNITKAGMKEVFVYYSGEYPEEAK